MNKHNTRILIVDDAKSLRDYLEIILTKEGYTVATAESGPEALHKVSQQNFSLIITDIRMPGMDGIELLKRIKEKHPSIPVVIMTAYSTWETAIEAMRLGACDFIRKPFENHIIKDVVNRLSEYCHIHKPLEKDKSTHLSEIIGNSPPMDQVFNQINQTAPTEATVLITGESGVGKELVARSLHYSSLRREASFISINCSALVSTLLENEIFGHTKGAYTGADREKKGLLEIAHKGTFFLDEIGDMDINLQGKILKVIEEREFYPVGSTHKHYIDVRFIAATNQDLEALIQTGRFRQDLFYRINVIPIHIPPLRERIEDIPLLAGHFLNKYSQHYNKSITGFDEEALNLLRIYSWPGNVRELENTIQRAILASRQAIITPDELISIQTDTRHSTTAEPLGGFDIPTDFDLGKKIESIERQYIEQALKLNNNNLTKAAQSLGISFRAIRYKIKKLMINKDNIETK